MSPAQEGTQATLAGTLRRPGGGASSWVVSAGSSGLNTTFRWWMPRLRSGNGQAAGVQFVAGAQSAEDGDAPHLRLLDEIQLAGHQVDGVYNVAVLGGEEVIPVLRIIGGADGVDNDVGMDIPAALGCRLCLGKTHGGCQGKELAVDVGYGQCILIDEGQFAHAGAGQSLHCVAAHTAQTEHGHMAASELVHSGTSQHHLRADKTFVHQEISFKTG